MKSVFYLLFSIFLMLGSLNVSAQIGIGTKTPAASAALEVTSSSNNKGILIPRITATQKDAIVSPAEGLLVYQTTAPIGFYYYTGGAWKLMAIQTNLAIKVDKVDGKNLSTNDYTTAEKIKLAAITGTNTGDQTTITGNAGTATKLATARNINGVAFDGSTDITIAAAADAGTLTGNTLKSTVTGSNLTRVGTLGNLTVTNPIAGSVTGNAGTATNLTGLTSSVATLNNLSGVNTGDQTTITGNAGTATKLATARNINGVAFDGSADITSPAAAETLTGTTLKSTVTGSSLTSVGTLANLTVTNPIAGSITGTASNVTGIVVIANGGTNSTATATAGGIGYGTGTAHAYTAAGTTGQVLSSNGAGVPTWTTPSGGVGGFTHYLGEAFNGGIIYYLYKGSDGLEHGLIVALTESTAQWQSPELTVNANRIEDGAFNTNLMTNSPAAVYIASLGAGWYLPSIDELGLLYFNRYSAQKGLRAQGKTLLSSTAFYWSSTEYSATQAYAFYCFYGSITASSKITTYPVRGVRAF